MTRFAISRTDGRSATEVICGLVKDARSGELLPYDKIAAALSEGTNKQYTRSDVQGAVGRAERQLACKLSRALMNVAGQGYKVALAAEHQCIAGRKRDRSQKLLKRGLTVLQNVNWDEMSPNERQAHEGQLMVVGALYTTMQGIDRRLSRVENAIKTRNENGG